MVKAERAFETSNVADPSTVVWVGPSEGPYVGEAFRWVLANASQVCLRASVKQWEQRPAFVPSHLIVVRNRRVPIREPLQFFTERQPHVQCLSLLGPECEGESRTGTSWPRFLSCPWHRWQQVLPNWLNVAKDTGGVGWPKKEEVGSSLVVGIAATQRSAIDDTLDLCQQHGHTAIWVNDFLSAGPRNLDAIIWDDSLASPANTAKWRARIASSYCCLKATRKQKHSWLVSFPRPEDWREARRAGIKKLFSKPFAARALINWLSER